MKLNDEQGVEPKESTVVAEGIVRVPLRTPTLPPATRTNAYIVRGRTGLWVVDPGAPDAGECSVLAAEMKRAEQELGLPIAGAILTHHHPDHVGGLGWWVSAVGLPVVAEQRTIGLVAGAVPGDALDELEATEWIAVDADGEVDGLSLVFTPGHAPGHLCVWTGDGLPGLARRVLIAGDLVAGIGTIVVSPPRGDMIAYLDSLRRAAALTPALLLPSHGPATTAAVERLEGYVAHRLAREAKVLSALGDTPIDSMAVTAVAYDDVPSVFHAFAERSVAAHLEKLVTEGRVRAHDSGYTLAD